MALWCKYPNSTSPDDVRHELEQVAIAIQLVKPSRLFLELWLQLDESSQPESVETSVRDFGFLIGPEPHLRYQQRNMIEEADLKRVRALLPNLAKALDRSQGSWEHPALSIHRAVIFFCQGYTVRPDDPAQFLWAAGLDCLYASKLDRSKQGSKEICARIEKLLGAAMKPYDAICLPMSQRGRKIMSVASVAPDIFRLRNAFAHGKPIPDTNWLGVPGTEPENGYAYQLLEQTESSYA